MAFELKITRLQIDEFILNNNTSHSIQDKKNNALQNVLNIFKKYKTLKLKFHSLYGNEIKWLSKINPVL